MARIKIDPTPDLIHGSVQPGFEPVREEFIRNFTQRGEVGAACAAYYKGEKVVDLWGGYRDLRTRAPWEEDTLVLVFSATKGLAAMALAVTHSQGLLDFMDPLDSADRWDLLIRSWSWDMHMLQTC